MSVLLAVVVILFLALSALFSGSEVALMACPRPFIDNLARKGSRRARYVLDLLDQPERFLTTILVGNNLANTGAVSLTTYVFVRVFGNEGEIIAYTTLIMTVALLLFSEITPKSIAAYRAATWSLWASPFIYYLMIVIYPVVRVTGGVVKVMLGLFGIRNPPQQPLLTLEELRGLLAVIRRYRSHLSDEYKMILRVSELARHTVNEIMIHRDRLVMIDIAAPLDAIESQFYQSGFSRFPVYQGNTDIVVGILYLKDFFRARAEGTLKGPDDIKAILRKPLKVYDSTTLDRVMAAMREEKVHIALVYNELGTFEGIVTLEDVLEEIVGEIEDEFDREPQAEHIKTVGSWMWIVPGVTPIKDLNEVLPEALPESADYTTLAGYLIKLKDDFPESGEVIDHPPYRYRVLEMAGRRIRTVKITLLEKEEREAAVNAAPEGVAPSPPEEDPTVKAAPIDGTP